MLTLALLGLFLSAAVAQSSYYNIEVPSPKNVRATIDMQGRTQIQWGPVLGHGSQDSLITHAWIDHSAFRIDTGQMDTTDWTFLIGGREFRHPRLGENTLHHSSSGFDILMFDTQTIDGERRPDSCVNVFMWDSLVHTPIPHLPAPLMVCTEPAKYDQIHHFNASDSAGLPDFIDVSSLGITHPDQLIWYEGPLGYTYHYLLIKDNDGDSCDVAAGLTFRASRTYGTFDLVRNVIYAQGQTTYDLYRMGINDSAPLLIATGLTDTLFTDTTTSGQAFSYQVRAVNHHGISDFSLPFFPGGTPFPLTWISFEAEKLPSGAVRLQWEAQTEQAFDRFEVERKGRHTPWEQVHAVQDGGAAEGRYEVIDAPTGMESVWYRIVQYGLDGTQSQSETLKVDLRAATWRIFPNPAFGQAQLQGLQPGQFYTLSLTDVQGRCLWTHRVQASQGNCQLPLQDCSSGLYILSVAGSGGQHTHQRLRVSAH